MLVSPLPLTRGWYEQRIFCQQREWWFSRYSYSPNFLHAFPTLVTLGQCGTETHFTAHQESIGEELLSHLKWSEMGSRTFRKDCMDNGTLISMDSVLFLTIDLQVSSFQSTISSSTTSRLKLSLRSTSSSRLLIHQPLNFHRTG